MHARTIAAAALTVCLLAFAGCASPAIDAVGAGAGTASPTPRAPETMPETPSASEQPASPAPEVRTAGEYLDFADGVIEQTDGPKVMFFHAPWCPQCRKLDEQLLAEGAPDDLTVFKVDYDSRSDLRQKYGVTLQTTVVFVDDSGELISSSVLYDEPSIASLVAARPAG